jgi:hypothetical protein
MRYALLPRARRHFAAKNETSGLGPGLWKVEVYEKGVEVYRFSFSVSRVSTNFLTSPSKAEILLFCVIIASKRRSM